MRPRSRSAVALALFIALPASSCEPSPVAEPPKTPARVDGLDGFVCTTVRAHDNPELMAWDAASRQALRRVRPEGVIAVRYTVEACNVALELLPDCLGPGTYLYTPEAASGRRIARDAEELFNEVPLGAPQLLGLVSGDRSVRIDALLAGRHALATGPTLSRGTLRGSECSRATHLVTAIDVGAFAITSGDQSGIESAPAGFGGETFAADGDAEACRRAQETATWSDGCDVPLRLELVALDTESSTDGPPVAAVESPPMPPVEPSIEPSPEPLPGPEMVVLPTGYYFMGSNDGRENERPPHRVYVSSFSIDRTEVTVDAFAACVTAGTCEEPSRGPYCNWGEKGRGRHPVNCVDWSQASMYCDWVGKRLPLEEEWEYAARGHAGRLYPWGNQAPRSQLCWSRWDSSQATCPVGSYPEGASPEGVLDLAGNVWEWTSSGYSADYTKARSNKLRVSRGGSWFSNAFPSYVRSAKRSGDEATYRNGFLGFRCAR